MFRRGRAFLTLDACETTRVLMERVTTSGDAKTREGGKLDWQVPHQ